MQDLIAGLMLASVPSLAVPSMVRFNEERLRVGEASRIALLW
jgi:hypothetical protein